MAVYQLYWSDDIVVYIAVSKDWKCKGKKGNKITNITNFDVKKNKKQPSFVYVMS